MAGDSHTVHSRCRGSLHETEKIVREGLLVDGLSQILVTLAPAPVLLHGINYPSP